MPIFKIENKKVVQLGLKRNGFGNEFELRDFFADNLEEILGVRFLEKEYTTTDGRIDTLGIDENDSPVIIEYKWKENDDVLSQGLFYLDWLKNNKPHFQGIIYAYTRRIFESGDLWFFLCGDGADLDLGVHYCKKNT